MDKEELITFEEQDLGNLHQTISTHASRRDVETMLPDDNSTHIDALKEVRQVIDKYYSEKLNELAADDEQVVVTRVTFISDDLPHFEYAVVPKMEDE